MQVSVVVALICTGILALVVYMRWSMITALIASLAFAATANRDNSLEPRLAALLLAMPVGGGVVAEVDAIASSVRA
ncbi:hypothetical protein [Mesorhizobium muleiense]|uniref:Uncharacterized protein n=1 Tax=Mesorhizobium muleiense TaxID=1004279 RepID=A0A1G8HRU1_9HYPH|nr:hypothetical protein [Mesorhizobium muleiense]MCF6099465.1 hypothetical protein [Mesorhizobium muleiense]SDI09349.1 hypothetical protein SAMN05428953_101149 [Mesorhizobium muleiense]